MGTSRLQGQQDQAERAIVVAFLTPDHPVSRTRCLAEIKGLAETAGLNVVGELTQLRDAPDVATLLGRGKLVELKRLAEQQSAKVVVFDNNLSPSQGRNLEKELKLSVADRSEVILDIFATHARTFESKLQVELAQLLYQRPRLKRLWTHLERIEGGIKGGKGPGEKQLELDRRMIDTRIAELRRRLSEVERRREQTVASRDGLPTVSLVGYTNAGKSTLMNALTQAGVYVADQLFATLDTRTRRWHVPAYGDVLLSDTVGFVRDLPHHLVASFKSTLEEARQAGVLLHVVDVSDPDCSHHVQTVNDVLTELEIEPTSALLVLNKIDRATDHSVVDILRAAHPHSITVSAVTGQGVERLADAVADRLGNGLIQARVTTTPGEGRIRSYLLEHGQVDREQFTADTAEFDCRITRQIAQRLRRMGAEVDELATLLDPVMRSKDDGPSTGLANIVGRAETPIVNSAAESAASISLDQSTEHDDFSAHRTAS